MRKGPHPLPLHIGMAMSKFSDKELAKMQFSSTLSDHDLVKMMQGIKMYQMHSYAPKRLRRVKIWEEEGWCLYSAISAAKLNGMKETPVILIPSIINYPDIFDLSKERSLMRWLLSKNIPCYLFDWGNFSNYGSQHIDISNVINERLVPAVRYVSNLWGAPVDCLGYCMGGTLLIGAHNSIKGHVRKLVLLAAPWDFHDPKMKLTDHVGLWLPAAIPVISSRNYLPSSWIQSLFATLDVDGSARKFIRFSQMDQNSEDARLFIVVEDWLNNGSDLPAALMQECIQEWFIKNAPFKGTWRIENSLVDGGLIKSNVLIIASERDRLVPFSAAFALKEKLSSAQVDILKLDCGHIGFIAGKNSISEMWKPLVDWLKDK